MPPKAATPRASKMTKLAETVMAVIEMVKKEKPPVAKIVSKLEAVHGKLSATKKARAAGTLSEYQKFVKAHMKDKELDGMKAPEKMKAIGQMWKKTKK